MANPWTTLPAVIPAAAKPSIEQQLAEATQREEALRIVLRALLSSLRPFAVNKARFKRIVREESEDTPNEGAIAARHAVMHQETRRVLRELR